MSLAIPTPRSCSVPVASKDHPSNIQVSDLLSKTSIDTPVSKSPLPSIKIVALTFFFKISAAFNIKFFGLESAAVFKIPLIFFPY